MINFPTSKTPLKTIGLLFELQADLLIGENATEATHYHWREPAEVEAVAEALTDLGYHVDLIGSVDQLLERWREKNLPELVWNLSVRVLSRSRTAIAPAILEQLKIPYTGADAACKSLVLNKGWLKPLLDWIGISTPPWSCYPPGEAIAALPPWEISILKPACEGYSLGLTRFESKRGLSALQGTVTALQQQFNSVILCEPLIVGREITVGVVGNPDSSDFPRLIGGVETLTLDEQPLQEQILDLKAKRQGGFKKVVVDLTTPELTPLQTVALKLMERLAPLDYATFDFRLTPEGKAYLLDVNADATLHPQRSFAQIATQNGLNYRELIGEILQTVIQRWELSVNSKQLPVTR